MRALLLLASIVVGAYSNTAQAGLYADVCGGSRSTARAPSLWLKSYSPRIEEAFREARQGLNEWVLSRSSLSEDQKLALVARINSVRLESPAEDAEFARGGTLQFGHVGKSLLRVRAGAGYFAEAPTAANLFFSMAHELAHAIDPCELSRPEERIAAYSALTSCFSERGWIQGVSCSENRQAGEAFADWVATAVLARQEARAPAAVVGGAGRLKAAFSDLCHAENPGSDPLKWSHPAPVTRLDAIIGGNPALRRILGDPSPTPYCSLD